MTWRGGAIIFVGFYCPQCPSPDATILNYLHDREGVPLYFVGFWRPPMPPPSPGATILNNLNDREGRHYLCRILRPQYPPPPPQYLPTTQYLTILMTERGGAIIICRILAPPNAPPPPSPDATILNYLDDREKGGGQYLCLILSPPIPPPPPPTPQYLTILMAERGGAIIFCRILAPPNALPLPQTL